jgi:TetR/AcrR family transcriptional repressor of nem operon
VAEVMKAAGLTHGAFYAYFGSKEELQAIAYGQKVSLESPAAQQKRRPAKDRLPTGT